MNTPAINFNVTISDIYTENQTLYASIDPLWDDPDGVGLLRYQWQRSDGLGGWINIVGATSTFYALGDADVGYEVRVVASYVDGGGTTETAYSAASSTIINVNDAPSGIPLISGELIEDGIINADVSSITDADGLPDASTFSYQWQRSADGGATWDDIEGATDASYTLTDSDSSNTVRVAVSYVDGHGTTETVTSAGGTVTNVNDAPVGFGVTISGDASEDATLTASASVTSDADGLPDPLSFTYQWQSSVDGSSWSNISGATSAQFTPGDAEVGLPLRVVTTYTDNQSSTETTISDATAAVAAINDASSGSVQMLAQVTLMISDPTNEFQVNTYTPKNQASPAVSALADGGWVVIWQSFAQDGYGDDGIYGQRYSSDGLKVGSEFHVNKWGNGAQYDASVTGLADGGWIVTFTVDNYGDGNGSGILGQRYADNGNKVGNEFVINTYYFGEQSSSVVAALDDGGWVVAWQSKGQDDGANSYGIYCQIYSAEGNRIGSEFRVNSDIRGDQDSPSISKLSDGGWIITWTSYLQDGSSGGIYGQRYNVAGSPVGSEFKVNDYTDGHQYDSSVTGLSDGGWVVAWSSQDRDGSGFGIYGQRYNSAGTATGSDFQFNTYTIDYQYSPSVAALSDGGWIVTWTSEGQDGSWGGIYGQRYRSSGFPVGSEFPINTYTENGQNSSSVAAISDGGWVVTWESSWGQDGSDNGIFGQRYDVYGNKEYTYFIDIFQSSYAKDFYQTNTIYADASLISDEDGIGLIAWQWQRSVDGGASWSDISGATGDSYTLGDDDVGNLVRLKGTYTDGQGFENTVYSDASTPVINVNDAPVGFGVTISGDASEDATLTASASVTSDADGLPDPLSFTYQWQSSVDGSSWSNISGATSAQFTPGDAEVGLPLRVVTTYTDNQGTVQTVTSEATAAIANVNNAPVGFTVTVSGNKVEDQTLTSSVGAISDADGVGTLVYQWQRSNDAGGWDNISGATSTSYTLGDSDVSRQIRLQVSYIDGYGTTESAFSSITKPINGNNDEPTGELQIASYLSQRVSEPAYEMQVNVLYQGNQTSPATTQLADGGWMVLWQSERTSGGYQYFDIYGQRYSAAGDAIGGEILFEASTNSSQVSPSAVSLPNGGFVLVWDRPNSGIFSQIFDGAGAPVSSVVEVNTFNTQYASNPSIALLGDGGWIITWTNPGQDDRSWGSIYDQGGIFGQRYNSQGEELGPEFQINSYALGNQTNSSVTALADGGWVVVWHSNGLDSAHSGIWGQRYDLQGAKVGGAFAVSENEAGEFSQTAITALADDGWLVTWSPYPSGGIYGQRFSSSGQKVDDQFGVFSESYGKSYPQTIPLSDGGWVISWQSISGDGLGADIYCQLFSALGEVVDNAFIVNTYKNGDQILPSISALKDGGWILTWQSGDEQDGSGYGIFSQRYDLNGETAYTYISPNSVASLSDFTENKVLYADPSLLVDPDGIRSIAWQWQRSDDGGTTWSDISGATGDSYTLGDDDVGNLVRLKGSYTDGQSFQNTVYSAASTSVINVNDAPVGFTVEVAGITTEDQTLTSSLGAIADADGVGTPLYQWQRSNDDGVTWTDISGATGGSYTLGDADVAHQIRLKVSYIDGNGTTETAFSPATAAIANVNDAPVVASAIADQSSAEDTAWSYVVPAGAFSDVDGDALTYSATLGDGSALPGWLTFTAATRTFSGTQPQNFNGDISLKVTASDGSLSASDTFVLSIKPPLQIISGTSGNDTLAGIAGNVSEITGGAGNDTIIGGSRADVAVFSGNRSDYTITTVAGVTTVIDNRAGSPDGTDTLKGMNILRFADIQLFQTTAANKMTLAGQTQTYNVANSQVVQGTNAAEHFVVAPETSALVFAGANDVVDLSRAIDSYTFTKTGTQLQISDGLYTTTLSVGGSFTLRTASGSTSVAIDFAQGGAIKLGGTQVVGSATFDPMAAILNPGNVPSASGAGALQQITGTSGNDTLSGVAGHVTEITGGAGNDTITGGSRADVAVFSGNRSDYTITTVAGVTTVIDNRAGSPDGTDTLKGLNILRFADLQLFQSAAANKMILAGQAQTYNVDNSEVVQGTSAAEHFIVGRQTSALVFAGNNDVVDLSGAIDSYSFAKTGTQLQISDGLYTTTLSVGGSFTLRTASGSTSVAIDFAQGGAIKLGGTQIVGSATFDPLTAITDPENYSDNAEFRQITVKSGATYNGHAGVADVFVIDASQSIMATIVGFEAGDVLEFTNHSAELGVSVEQAALGDALATLLAGNATINLTALANDNFNNETSFEAIYGANAIGYVI